MAKKCGCDAVKFQKRTIDKVYTDKFLNSYRESPWGKTQRDQKRGLEFGKKEYDEIDEYCREKEIDWYASAWDEDSQVFLDKYNLKYNKIASPMLTHRELLMHVARQKKKTIISTGMSSWEEMDYAVNIFRFYSCPFVVMHCVSVYPCPPDYLNLNMIKTIKKRYKCDIGYSGHSQGILDTSIAVAFGAKYIEKHITLDRSMYGSDQSASLERQGLIYSIRNARVVNGMLGNGKNTILSEEEKNKIKLRYWE
jgi:N-acetylneuraminate synthase